MQKYTNDIEIYKRDLKEAHGMVEKLISENQPEIDDLKSKIAGIDSNIAKIEKERNKIISHIDRQYLNPYEYIRSNRKDRKIISIVEKSNRNCTVCFQVLQPQVVNKVRKGEEIVFCQSCGSILIWHDDKDSE